MRVELLKPYEYLVPHKVGDVFDVPEKVAGRWIDMGMAKKYEPPKPRRTIVVDPEDGLPIAEVIHDDDPPVPAAEGDDPEDES